MKIQVTWSQPIILKEDSDLIYSHDVLEEISAAPGIYIFARKYGNKITPLYVGKAALLNVRVKTQLNNLKLMKQVQNWEKNGKRVLLIGYIKESGKQDTDKVLTIVERALIEHNLAEGHPLVNVQGTKTPVHSLNFQGNQYSLQVAPRQMFVKV